MRPVGGATSVQCGVSQWSPLACCRRPVAPSTRTRCARRCATPATGSTRLSASRRRGRPRSSSATRSSSRSASARWSAADSSSSRRRRAICRVACAGPRPVTDSLPDYNWEGCFRQWPLGKALLDRYQLWRWPKHWPSTGGAYWLLQHFVVILPQLSVMWTAAIHQHLVYLRNLTN